MTAWIRNFHPAPAAGVRLFCFPHAGGAAGAYRALSAALPDGIEALAVQYPGRQDRFTEPCLDDIHALADACLPELRPYADEPFALFGHSMGALVAYEVARRLEAAGHTRPAALIVSGRQAPALPRQPGTALPPAGADDERLVAEVRGLGGDPDGVLDHPGVRALALPALRADFRAVSTYRRRPGPPLSCPLVVLTGDRDPWVPIDGARAWREETGGPFELHVLPGGHFYLNDQLPGVAGLITDVLRPSRFKPKASGTRQIPGGRPPDRCGASSQPG
ncbi:thioesterase II family protein [Streptomyces sp. CB03234]|uniref:thioesterase II family protein n=1 Tax=Streptomyces sp. (strain CB03234) TaxID=1703937 RepID=UPI0009395964|nr:alpha/beta fold hydrolase [Streptomyces sp. CB03234]